MTVTDPKEFAVQVEDAAKDHFSVYPDVPSEVMEQVRGAATAVDSLRNVIGKHPRYSVSLAGHANAGHKKETGQVNDSVTISITAGG